MFTVFGSQIFLRQKSGVDIDVIPAGTFGVGVTMEGTFYLYPKNDMEIPAVTYGDTDDKSERIIKTFLSRKGKNTGILLEGTKGSGKTLQAKMLSVALRKIGIPTISIGSAFNGEGFINFMSKIKQPVMVMVDEFDKLYAEKEHQDGLLTLLDGVGGYDKLFVLTKNDGYVSEFLRNRPSRIFYSFSYKKLPKSTLDDYLAKNLENKAFLADFETLYNLSSDLNFDVIQSLVEELNRYPNDKFSDALTLMGISINEGGRSSKEIKLLKVNGVDRLADVTGQDLSGLTAQTLFSGGRFQINVNHHEGQNRLPAINKLVTLDEQDSDEDWYYDCDRIFLHYDEKSIKSMGADGYHFLFTQGDDTIEILVTQKETPNYMDYAFSGSGLY
ncbi:ATPase [Klebsiella phage phi1_175008]|uniref:ATPase n=2 Tax=Klebsiella phage phi1_175008 TaxID=3127744 RepID=A0ACD5FRH4_9CAUD